jgi:hypothetical protein
MDEPSWVCIPAGQQSVLTFSGAEHTEAEKTLHCHGCVMQPIIAGFSPLIILPTLGPLYRSG